MRFVADLHLHGRYARACSKNTTIKLLEKYARLKGISILGTGDFQHPLWQKELKEELVQENDGIYYTKTKFPFILQTEISLMYSHAGKGRRIHNIVLAPHMDVVNQITEALSKRGRLDYDGRPIFKIPCPEFVDMLKSIHPDIEVIPAHIFTPWFSLFGSMSGFDSVKECFQDQTKHIHAIETGLSSDPAMNWRLSQLDNLALVSFSDAHSYWPWRLGREATVFDLPKLSYPELIRALRTKEGIAQTLEFFPEEGKYHYDGHRKCNVCFAPTQSIQHNNLCPQCGTALTLGVLNRIEKLADRPEGFRPKNAVPFTNLIPLAEIISAAYNVPVTSKKMWAVYTNLITTFGNEFTILMDASEDDLKKHCDERLLSMLIQNRQQKIKFRPGYDGEYGHPIFDETNETPAAVQEKPSKKQKDLKEFS